MVKHVRVKELPSLHDLARHKDILNIYMENLASSAGVVHYERTPVLVLRAEEQVRDREWS